MLRDILKSKRFPSPIILEGKNRADFILEITQYALCETQEKCGSCRSCKQIAKGFHPDWLSMSGMVKIEDLRDRLFQLRQRPYQSKLRVFSYDDADEASVFVQNALLKTLEEPQPHWVLVLGVNSKLSLLPTIRSRCLFYKLPDLNVATELSESEEKIFHSVTQADELALLKDLEPILKDRQKAKAIFQKLLLKSAEQKYPGHWMNLSPLLEQTFPELARNLNPKLVWDRAWAKSFTEFV